MAHRNRLTTAQFGKVYEDGQRLNHRWFTLRVLRVPDHASDGARWGFAVGKRLAPGSVERNRLRRRLREAVRDLRPPYPGDFVVQLRPAGKEQRPTELRSALESLFKQLGSS